VPFGTGTFPSNVASGSHLRRIFSSLTLLGGLHLSISEVLDRVLDLSRRGVWQDGTKLVVQGVLGGPLFQERRIIPSQDQSRDLRLRFRTHKNSRLGSDEI